MDLKTLDQAKLKNKKVLLRAGFDIPINNGQVSDVSRIEKLIPTMKYILTQGAALIIMSHQGRPKGKIIKEMSQEPLVAILSKMLKTPVLFASSCTGKETKKKAVGLKPGQVLLLENLRFDDREKKNDPVFSKELAELADIYVNDSFTTCHRAHASIVGVTKILPSYAGLQLQAEIENLSPVLVDPRHPVTLIISGAKMETKVPVIKKFLEIGDNILLGGCIANTFIAARGFDVGNSKYEEQNIEIAREIMLESEKEEMATVQVPRDCVVASKPSETADKLDLPIENIVGDMCIFDIGKVTIKRYADIISKSGTVIWNGPLGLYEYNRFSHATKRIAEAVINATEKNKTISILGGGDTIDFHTRYKYPLDKYTFVSTGGGAMLSFLAGESLPGLDVLLNK